MNIRRIFLGMAVLCGFSVSAAAEGHFDKLSDRVKEAPEPVVEGTVVRQEGSGKGKLIDDVNVFVGTDGFGNVYPGPQVPFGGIQISPDCDDKDYDCAAGYKYSKPFIQGFSLTHLSGTGIPDMGDFLFLPGTGSKMDPSTYDHNQEWGEPGYYGVILKDYGVKAEMTAARRSGIFKFTFPQSDSSFVMIDLDHTLKWDCLWSTVRLLDERTIIGSKVVNGWNPGRYVYFVARFSRPIEEFNIFQDGQPVIYNTKRFRSSLEAWGQKLEAVARFKTGADESIFIDVAVSAVGTDGALNNLKELEGKDFAAVRTEAEDLWEKELGKYELDSDDKTLRETFYTSVYRTALHPFLFEDADGRFREHDGTIGNAEDFTNVTTFSLWDTYRAFHPLLNLVNKPLQADIANSMLAHFDKSTEKMLPIWSFYGGETWCMIGYHACSVLADMMLKGVRGFDYERAFQAMKTTATNPHYDCIPEYTSLGYVPFDKEKESVSKTLEYAYDDWCIAQAAKLLGHREDYEFFLNRSMNYRNLIDPETGYMRGKDSAGAGATRSPLSPIRVRTRSTAGETSRKGSRCSTRGQCRTISADMSRKPAGNCSRAASTASSPSSCPRIFPERTTSGAASAATGTATSLATTSPICTTGSASRGSARNGCATSPTTSTATSPAR